MELGIANTTNTSINTNIIPTESKVSHIKSVIPSSRNVTPELQIQETQLSEHDVSENDSVVKQAPGIDETADAEEKVNNILNTYFRGRQFHFEVFAKVNNIDFDLDHKPHSDIVKYSFDRMHRVCLDLLDKGIMVDKGENGTATIKLTAEAIIDAYNRVANYDNFTTAQKAYKLYSELGNIISEKLFVITNNDYFIQNKKCFRNCIVNGSEVCKSVLSLPLVNFTDGIKMCTNMLRTTLVDEFSDFKLSEPELLLDQKTSADHQKLVNDFKALGINFAFADQKLATEILQAAKNAISVGMKMPLFMTEFLNTSSVQKDDTAGASDDLIGFHINTNTTLSTTSINGLVKFDIVYPRYAFYHENTHHSRSAVGAMNTDKSLVKQNEKGEWVGIELTDILKGQDNAIARIKQQISEYALSDCEEYIAEFSAHILSCLESNVDPCDYIQDEDLWLLYYELGGPDFTQAINNKIYLPCRMDTLNDESFFGHLSGYPSKFGIDIRKIENQQVEVEGMVAVGVKTPVTINDKTILPPPPLGYRYTTDNKKLQLQDIASRQYYDPTFCSLTNGPLTLMKTNPQLVHHFELL